jgi:hypothetical protein
MGQPRNLEIHYLESIQGGMTRFFTPQASHETMLVQIPANTIDDLFVHKSQTDQLLVVKGEFVLVTLINNKYQYIPLSENRPAVVKIPTGVLHGAINFNPFPCVVVNAVLRHRTATEKDYTPFPRPYPYDLDAARETLKQLNMNNQIEFSI